MGLGKNKIKIQAEDVNNNVQKLVGEQLQKQFDFFEQSSAASGQDYKFTTTIEILDGGNGANTPTTLETFELYGCFVTNAKLERKVFGYDINKKRIDQLKIGFDKTNEVSEEILL